MRVVSISILIAAHQSAILQHFNKLNIIFVEFKFKELISGIPFDTIDFAGQFRISNSLLRVCSDAG